MSELGAHEATPSGLAHHFEDIEQQNQSLTLGMWAFLITEVMFFGGLFLAYAVYRYRYPAGFAAASEELDPLLGALNTGVLLGSSLTMALAVRNAELSDRRGIAKMLWATLGLGALFLIVKAFEYAGKAHHGLVPGALFDYHGDGPANEVELFMGLYFALTGLHATHMIIGMVIIALVARRAASGRYDGTGSIGVEVLGLYWHFVDLVWIFLFPLLYLIGRHA